MLRMQRELNIPSHSVKLKSVRFLYESWMNEVTEDYEKNWKIFIDDEFLRMVASQRAFLLWKQ